MMPEGESSMMELFLTELQTQTALLTEELAKVHPGPQTKQLMEPLVRAAHSIKGAARILQLQSAVALAAAMEQVFALAEQGKAELTQEQLTHCEEANQQFITLSKVAADDVPTWLEKEKEQLATLTASFGEGPPPPKEEKPELPAPETPETPEMPPLIDTSMMDLFRVEVETQTAILNEGLLAIEAGEEKTEQLEALMRAAHSIKGAARVVGLDLMVSLAHATEDCFVAAQEGKITIAEKQVDVLLAAVDLVSGISTIASTVVGPWLQGKKEEIDRFVEALQTIRKGEEPPELPQVAEEKAAPEVKKARVGGAEDRVLRVTAESLNKLMGLAGESLVESRWLQPFSDSLLQLKKNQNELATGLEKLGTQLEEVHPDERLSDHFTDLMRQANDCRQGLVDHLVELDVFIRRHENLSDRLYREVINSRMRPFADGVEAFPRMVRDMARKLDKKVKFEVEGKATPVDRDILEKLEAPLNHLLRNAVDHGIEDPKDREAVGKPTEGTICLEARHRAGMLAISVRDDGKGINIDKLRQKVVKKKLVTKEMADQLSAPELMEFLYLPGFSTSKEVSEYSGRGVGLDVVRAMVQEVGGVVHTMSEEEKGTTVNMQLPLTLSVIRTLLVEIAGEPYGFPLARIDRALVIRPDEIRQIENREYFSFREQNIGLVPGHQVLDLESSIQLPEAIPVIVMSDPTGSYGITVDRFLGERELVVQDLESRLGKIPNISCGAIMEDGAPCLIVDVEDMVRTIDSLLAGGRPQKVTGGEEAEEKKTRKRVLVVDDSITVREVECRLLENQGYQVDTAVNGVEAWNALRLGKYDLVLTDVDMPRMDGIALIKAIRSDKKLKKLPVVIVSYKEREQDRMAGLDAGADYYLTKSSFHDETLIQAVEDLVGKA